MSIRDKKGNLQARHAFPAYKVFIYGIEVTEDIFNVEVNYNTGRAPNTCTLTLSNDLDKYLLTTADFKVLFGGDAIGEAILKRQSQLLSKEGLEPEEIEKLNVSVGVSEIDQIILGRVQTIKEDIKRQVLDSKVNIRTKGVEQPDIAGKFGGGNIRQYTADAYRYPFQADDPIFHANDPIRIFERDPFNPRRWYHQFSGYLSNFDDHVDENNQSILTIGGEGPSKLLRYARVTTNPGIVDAKAIVQSEDIDFRSAFSEGFSGLSLPELLFTIIFGTDPEGEGGKFKLVESSPSGRKIRSTKINGAGHFRISGSGVVEFGSDEVDPLSFIGVPSASITKLEQYQSLIDHEVKETDLDEMLAEDATGLIPVDHIIDAASLKTAAKKDSRDPSKVATEEIIRIIGTRTDLYPIDGGRLIMLLPKSLHAEINREVLLKDVLRSFAMNTQFKSRLGIIYDVIERIEFLFYESPKGDLICEFPLYDFDPDDFGTKEVPHYSLSALNRGVLTPNENIKRGPFASRYTVSKRDTYNFSRGITDEKIRTQVAAPWYYLQNYTEVGTSQTIQPPAIVTLRHLVPLYWLRLEQVDPKGFIASKEAAQLYAQITLNKFNADAKNLGINAVPNLGLCLNRPIFFERRNCIGVLMGINHSITWGMGGSMDTRLNLNYIRSWDGLLDKNGEVVYTPIGGQPSRPLDYKLLFKLKSKSDGAAKSAAPDTELGDGE